MTKRYIFVRDGGAADATTVDEFRNAVGATPGATIVNEREDLMTAFLVSAEKEPLDSLKAKINGWAVYPEMKYRLPTGPRKQVVKGPA